jgi:3-hydroxybutyryl-CoA dehydratase
VTASQVNLQARVLNFDEVQVGLSTTFVVTITEAMLLAFGGISGDLNPLHVDAAYAQSVGHPTPVVYGMLTASFYSQLVGMHLPGKHALLQQVEVGFTAPVYVGDLLKVEGVVADVHESVRQIEIKASISNQHTQQVSRAKIRVGMYA